MQRAVIVGMTLVLCVLLGCGAKTVGHYKQEGTTLVYEIRSDGTIYLENKKVATKDRVLRIDGKAVATVDAHDSVSIEGLGTGRFVEDTFEAPDKARVILRENGNLALETRSESVTLGQVEGAAPPPRILLLVAYLSSRRQPGT